MRDASPYAGATVQLRDDALELGGLPAEVVDWYERTSEGVSWRDNIAGDPRAQSYAIRRDRSGLPDDDDVLLARVDGMGCLIHRTEIVGEGEQPTDPYAPVPVSESEIGEPCPACMVLLRAGDQVAVRLLGPGDNPAARALARAGEPFQSVAVELHWACVTGDETYQLPPEDGA